MTPSAGGCINKICRTSGFHDREDRLSAILYRMLIRSRRIQRRRSPSAGAKQRLADLSVEIHRAVLGVPPVPTAFTGREVLLS